MVALPSRLFWSPLGERLGGPCQTSRVKGAIPPLSTVSRLVVGKTRANAAKRPRRRNTSRSTKTPRPGEVWRLREARALRRRPIRPRERRSGEATDGRRVGAAGGVVPPPARPFGPARSARTGEGGEGEEPPPPPPSSPSRAVTATTVLRRSSAAPASEVPRPGAIASARLHSRDGALEVDKVGAASALCGGRAAGRPGGASAVGRRGPRPGPGGGLSRAEPAPRGRAGSVWRWGSYASGVIRGPQDRPSPPSATGGLSGSQGRRRRRTPRAPAPEEGRHLGPRAGRASSPRPPRPLTRPGPSPSTRPTRPGLGAESRAGEPGRAESMRPPARPPRHPGPTPRPRRQRTPSPPTEKPAGGFEGRTAPPHPNNGSI